MLIQYVIDAVMLADLLLIHVLTSMVFFRSIASSADFHDVGEHNRRKSRENCFSKRIPGVVARLVA